MGATQSRQPGTMYPTQQQSGGAMNGYYGSQVGQQTGYNQPNFNITPTSSGYFSVPTGPFNPPTTPTGGGYIPSGPQPGYPPPYPPTYPSTPQPGPGPSPGAPPNPFVPPSDGPGGGSYIPPSAPGTPAPGPAPGGGWTGWGLDPTTQAPVSPWGGLLPPGGPFIPPTTPGGNPGGVGGASSPGGGLSNPIDIYSPGYTPGGTGSGWSGATGGAPGTGPEHVGGNWFTGNVFAYPGVPPDIASLRWGLQQYLTQDPSQIYGYAPAAAPIVNPGQNQQVMAQMLEDPNRMGVRDVNAPGTQSVDQLGGVNSPFFQNIQAQLQPAFDVQNQRAIAQAKEGAGNLSGSGLGNYISNALTNNLAGQNQILANYATQGLGMELQRQQQAAQLGLSGQQANQGADINFMQSLLNSRLANQGAGLQAGLANAGNQQAYDLARANLASQRNSQIYSTNADLANQNAQRYADIIRQISTAGVGPQQIVQQGGAGSVLGQIAGTALGLGGAYALGQLLNGSGGQTTSPIGTGRYYPSGYPGRIGGYP